MRIVLVSLATAAAVVAVVASSHVQEVGVGADPAADRAALAAALTSHAAGGAVVRSYERLTDFLPNVRHTSTADPERRETRVTDSVVRGTVVTVEEDRGFVEIGPATRGRPGAVATDYDDPTAWWRTLRVTVQVEEVIAGPQSRRLTFYLPLMGSAADGEDGAAVARGLHDLGEIVLFSRPNPAGPEYLGLTRKLPNEPLSLATVGDVGELDFPFADEEDGPSAEEFMAGLDTLEELRAQARKPSRVKEERTD
jgi:hypothetical protein